MLKLMKWKKEAAIYAQKQQTKESCGLVAVFNGEEKFWPCKNIAEDKDNFFALDPEDWANCEDIGGQVVGVFHSHPKGTSQPSHADKVSCEYIGYPYYIYSLENNTWNYIKPENWEKLNIENNTSNHEEEKLPNLKRIRVYGKLKEFVGKTYFDAAVKTPQQAISFLRANFVGIDKHLSNFLYKIKIGGNPVNGKLLSMSGEGDIQIIPVAIGAGFFDFITKPFEIIADVVSDVANFVGDVVSTAYDFVSNNLLTVGLSIITGSFAPLLLAGASQLLAPQQPSMPNSAVGDTDPRIRGSYNFSGIQNITQSGVPIPIIYGLVYSGSIIISSGVDTAQIVKEVS